MHHFLPWPALQPAGMPARLLSAALPSPAPSPLASPHTAPPDQQPCKQATGVPLVDELMKLGSVAAAAHRSLHLLAVLAGVALVGTLVLRAADAAADRRIRGATTFNVGAALVAAAYRPCKVWASCFFGCACCGGGGVCVWGGGGGGAGLCRQACNYWGREAAGLL